MCSSYSFLFLLPDSLGGSCASNRTGNVLCLPVQLCSFVAVAGPLSKENKVDD